MTYYSLEQEGAYVAKHCWSCSSHSTFSKAGTRAFNYAKVNEDKFDEDAPIWDISLEELGEAYKTTAMKRHVPWDTEKNHGGKNCLPFYKIFKKHGNFPRRITWLYADDGNYLLSMIFTSISLIGTTLTILTNLKQLNGFLI